MSNIDPIVVQEQADKIYVLKQKLDIAEKAAEALLWFAEHAQSRQLIGKIEADVLQGAPSVIATGTRHAQVAQKYIHRAAQNHYTQIIKDAIIFAEADFAAGRVTNTR